MTMLHLPLMQLANSIYLLIGNTIIKWLITITLIRLTNLSTLLIIIIKIAKYYLLSVIN